MISLLLGVSFGRELFLSTVRCTSSARQGDIPGVQLRCRRQLSVPAATAWRWLTEPVALASWAGRASLEGGLEGVLELESEADGGLVRERGRTLELADGRRWVLAFERLNDGWETATRLTFEISERGAGSELSVFQEGFEHLPLSRCRRVALESLTAAAADG
jgi:uncharacterized protein YndB with AHSA1/START domain